MISICKDFRFLNGEGMAAAHSEGSNETGLLGLRWFFGAGTVAVIFSLFHVWADNYLSTSNKEEILNRTLHEIRDAQTSLPSRVTDPRQLAPVSNDAHEETGHGEAVSEHSGTEH